jgi:hypothetical protein
MGLNGMVMIIIEIAGIESRDFSGKSGAGYASQPCSVPLKNGKSHKP